MNTRTRMSLALILIILAVGGQAPPSWGSAGPAVPDAPHAPGSLGALAPPVDPGAEAAVNEAAMTMLTTHAGLTTEQARRSLAVQAKGDSLGNTLLEKLGRGLSQVRFDNKAGEFVVALSPNGDAKLARDVISELGLDTSEAIIERSGLASRAR